MMRGAVVAAAVLLVACGSAEPEPPATVPPPTAAAPLPDPRIAEMQVLLNELMDRIEVLTARLAALETGSVPAAPPQTAAAPPRRTLSGGPASAPASKPAPQTAPARMRPASATIGDRYKEAIALFGKGRLDDARGAFEQILASDPGGDLADNALFWIGETHYVQGRFEDALAAYRRIVAEYGNENKAPDAMLKIGMAQAKLGDLAMARATFEQLIERYPYSTAAATARHEIDRIRY